MSNNSDVEAVNGGYNVVVNGQQVGGTYTNLQQAQQAFNNATGQSNGPSSPSAGAGQTYNTPNGQKTLDQMTQGLLQAGYNGPMDPASIIAAYNKTASGSGANPAQSAQAFLDAIASGNSQAAAEAAQQFQQDLAERQREFNITNATNQQKNYEGLATTLLGDASKLTGPADYYQFLQYANGGRDLMQQLFGNQPNAAFQAPSGTNTPMSIGQLMTDLGFTQAPQVSGTSATDVAVSADQINKAAQGLGVPPGIVQDYVNQNHQLPPDIPSLQTFMNTNGYRNSDGSLTSKQGPSVTGYTPTASSGNSTNTASNNAPGTTPTTSAANNKAYKEQSASNSLFYNPITGQASHTPTQVPAPSAPSASNPSDFQWASLGLTSPPPNPAPATNPTIAGVGASSPQQTFLNKIATTSPFKINPATYNALGTAGQALVKSAVGAAGWDPNQWLSELKAASPVGKAPTNVSNIYSTPAGKSLSQGPSGVY